MSAFWQEVLARPREILAKLSRGQRLGVLALVSVGAVVAILSSLLAGRQSFALLYGGMEPSAASEVVAKLSELGVPYRLTPDGTAVQVPEERVAELKMQLASAGLPALGSRGFEIFDENQLGVTDSLFNVNLQRALQGELERSIQSCGPVKSARVLVHLQPQGIFLRDRARASAAVTLWLRPGFGLAESEVAAIAHLVASSVGHGMTPRDVTITDGELALLHPRGDEEDPLFSAAHLQRVQRLERHLEEKAESQLRSAFGEGKALVRVAVELNLTHRETAKETFKEDNKVPVRTTSSEDSTISPTGGDPSVASGGAAKSGSGVTRSEKTNEFREGVERELEIATAGSIQRLSVSLLLDEGDEALKGRQAEIGELVKSAVGFSEAREDKFQVALAPFAKPAAPPEAPGPFAIENLLPLAGHLVEAVTVLFVLVLLVKTVRGGKARAKAKSKAAAGAEGAGSAESADPDNLEIVFADGKGPDMRTRLGRFVERNPDKAREVLTTWLKEEMAS